MAKRDCCLDNIRTFAIWIVVLCHSVEFVLLGGIPFDISGPVLTLCMFLHGLARAGVPLFLFLSGYLLLDKEYKTERDVFNFWKTKLIPLIVTWVVWVVCFYLFKCWYDKVPFSFENLMYCVFMRERTYLSHDWYMYMLIGLYCIYPFLSMILKKFSLKIYVVVLGVIYVFYLLLPTVTNVILKDVSFFNLVLSNAFVYNSYYILYVIIGYCLKKYDRLKLNLPVNFIGFIISMAITVLYSVYRNSIGEEWYIWYDFCILPFTSLFLFNLLRTIKLPVLIEKLSRRFSVCSFGVYLLHWPIQYVMNKFLDFSLFSWQTSFAIKLFGGFFISYVIVEVISRIKYLNKLLFLIK